MDDILLVAYCAAPVRMKLDSKFETMPASLVPR